jgi:hypothetical protein
VASNKSRALVVVGIGLIVSVLFMATFLRVSGAACLPPAMLGAPPRAKAVTSTFSGSDVDVKVLQALIVAADKASPVPAETANNSTKPLIDDTSDLSCRLKGRNLLLEVGATLLAALILGLWMIRRRG